MSVKKLIVKCSCLFILYKGVSMKSLIALSSVALVATTQGMPANAQRVDYGGYQGGGSGQVQQQQSVPTPPQAQPTASSGGKAGQIQNLLSINGLTPIPCGFGVAKVIFPNLGEVCISAQPGRFETGATYSFDQASNTINRVGAAAVNNGSGSPAPQGQQQVIVPVASVPQPVLTPVMTDEAFALQTLSKNGLSVAVCNPGTAQFLMSGKLVACATPNSQFPAGQYNISR